MLNFVTTPSFYDTEEKFKNYLGQTSFYKKLQYCVSKLVSIAKPDVLADMGIGTGNTTFRLARENPNCNIIGIDIREEMINNANTLAMCYNLHNITLKTMDMTEYFNFEDELPDFMVFLYAFHHIEDPLDRKIDFLKQCKERMNPGSKLCIAETFLPESISIEDERSKIQSLWSRRIIESYTSTFWSSLEGLSSESIISSKKIAEFSLNNEYRAGNLVAERDNEYLVKISWLVETAVKLGFRVDIAEYCNSVGDGIVLLSI
jgi:ubiquinone/menaquinone biosynthesis C-methylase UbiE